VASAALVNGSLEGTAGGWDVCAGERGKRMHFHGGKKMLVERSSNKESDALLVRVRRRSTRSILVSGCRAWRAWGTEGKEASTLSVGGGWNPG